MFTLASGSNLDCWLYQKLEQNVGDTAIWEVASQERLAYRNFKVWEISYCSIPMQVDVL